MIASQNESITQLRQ